MTRGERENAIRCLKKWIEEEPYLQTYKTCLEALEREPCEDAISRQAAIDTTICEGISCNECSFNEIEGKPGCLLHYRICKMPPVSPARPKGKWIWKTEDIYMCSECGEDIHVKEVMNVPQYICCPMCYADMRGDNNDQ